MLRTLGFTHQIVIITLSISVAAGDASGQAGNYRGASVPLTPAMKYFGRAVQPVAPAHHVSPAPQPVPRQAASKPFDDVLQPSSISPYLNLDRLELDVSLPNYHAFVLPQLEQEEELQRQAAELRRPGGLSR